LILWVIGQFKLPPIEQYDRLTKEKVSHRSGRRKWAARCLRLFEIACVLVPLDHVASIIVNADHGIV
jgi:hypothetical protein